jgi:hypothetical protein
MIVLLPFDNYVRVTCYFLLNIESFSMRSFIKIKRLIFLFLLVTAVSACQTKVSENKTLNLGTFFSEYRSDMDVVSEYTFSETKKLKYKDFKKENIEENVKIAILNDPAVQGFISKVEATKQEVEEIRASKAIQAQGSLSGGAKREDNESEAALVGQLTAQKLMFDFGATDAAIAASTQMVKIAELETRMEAEKVALTLYTALIDFHKTQEVNKIYEQGMALAKPLLGQIKNISLSGITDKSSLLEAQEKYTRLEIGLENSRSAAQISENNFLNLFQIESIEFVDKVSPMIVKFQEDDLKSEIINNYQFKTQYYYKNAKILQKKSLEVGNSPSISLSTTLIAPVEDFSEESVANAGFLVNYVFNDGGSREAQIAGLKADIDYIQNNEADLLAKLTLQLNNLNREYIMAKKNSICITRFIGAGQRVKGY